jgi:hypothetical protein
VIPSPVKFDLTINLGHVLTVLSVVMVWFFGFRVEQVLQREQLRGIHKWIDDHDECLKTNMELFQEMRTQAVLTTALLESLTERVERSEKINTR